MSDALGPRNRVIRAVRVTNGLVREAEETLAIYVALARLAGCSWSEIGAASGLSRQGAHHRWAKSSKEEA